MFFELWTAIPKARPGATQCLQRNPKNNKERQSQAASMGE
jgi:hypothetical protein